MKRSSWVILAGVMVLCLMAVPAFSGEPPIEERVSGAATATDHEAVAEYFDREASEADARAAQHERLAGVYARKGGKGFGKRPMKEHCEKLAERYRADAEAYRSMAEAHREAAKGD